LNAQLINFKQFRAYYFSENIPAWIQGTIIDLETRGLSVSSNITALGLIKGDKISCFVIHPDDEMKKQKEWRYWIKNKISRSPRPYSAYYKDFEEQFLYPEIIIDIELQPKSFHKKERAVNLWHFTNTSNSTIADAEPNEIMQHLYYDMLEELALYMSLSHKYRSYEFKTPEITEEGN
jgi:hypothetical protein